MSNFQIYNAGENNEMKDFGYVGAGVGMGRGKGQKRGEKEGWDSRIFYR